MFFYPFKQANKQKDSSLRVTRTMDEYKINLTHDKTSWQTTFKSSFKGRRMAYDLKKNNKIHFAWAWICARLLMTFLPQVFILRRKLVTWFWTLHHRQSLIEKILWTSNHLRWEHYSFSTAVTFFSLVLVFCCCCCWIKMTTQNLLNFPIIQQSYAPNISQ